MAADGEYFLFVGSGDTESATTQLRASGVVYRKKLLNSGVDNWFEIAALIASPNNRGTLVVLTGNDYESMFKEHYREAATSILDALAGRPHLILVHEAVFLTDDQRAATVSEQPKRVEVVNVTPRIDYEEYWGMTKEEYFGSIPDEVRSWVNTRLRERRLEVVPYRTNAERSIVASGFVEDSERHLLFRLYVPSGRLYAQEAESLLGLFREWLGQIGRNGIRQEGYSTAAGQVFEFFSSEGDSGGQLTQSFQDFSSFLESCVSSPEAAAEQLTAVGIEESAAALIVSRFATKARRITLDLRQRREERIMGLKHHLENVMLETQGLTGEDLSFVLEEMLPSPGIGNVLEASSLIPAVVHNYKPQFVNQVTGAVIQSVAGTINLTSEAKAILELIERFGDGERVRLETAVHELEDEEARGADRVAARGRLKRFLADLGSRGVDLGVNVLQKYVENRIGIS